MVERTEKRIPILIDPNELPAKLNRQEVRRWEGLTLPEVAKYSELSIGYIRFLVKVGRLQTIKKGVTLLTTRKWIDHYDKTKSPRGRKPKKQV